MGKLPVLVQVYSVREDAQKDLEGTLAKIKALGYDGVELAGTYGRTAEQMRAALDGAGLRAISAHVPYQALRDETEKTVDDYVAIGCEYIAIPWLEESMRPGNVEFLGVVANIPRIGEACRARGAQLLYHNHDFEFAKMPDGRFALDYIYDSASADVLQTEIDVCWVKVAGEDPVSYIGKYAGRAPVVHLKDFFMKGEFGLDATKREGFEFRPVGHGVQDMPPILDAAARAGAKWVVVEQDSSVGRTPMEAIAMSREFLRGQGF